MSTKCILLVHKIHRSWFLTMGIIMIFTLALVAASSFKQYSQVSAPSTIFQAFSMTRSYTGLPYDEQSGVTFTQDFSSLTFNVTAVAQTGPDGIGPGYLLSALTDAGYWYQAGLSWKWPQTAGGSSLGFSMNYEVFDPSGRSIFPYSGGGGITGITTNAGDTVLLSLNFTGGNVLMQAYDWNSTSTASETFSDMGASYFVGSPNTVSQNGFFTGLMTEEYHSRPYMGTGQVVIYSDSGFNYSSAWMWIDEFNTATGQGVFAAQTRSSVVFDSTSTPAYFSSNGTAEVATNHELITGLSPVSSVTLQVTSPTVLHAGESSTLTLTFDNPDTQTRRLTSLRVLTDFGNYNVSSAVSENLSQGSTNHPVSIILPSSVTNGTHYATVIASWQTFDSQLQEWVTTEPTQASTLLTVSSGIATPPNQSQTSGNWLIDAIRSPLLPGILVYIGLAALAAFLVVNRRRRERREGVAPLLQVCPGCGQETNPGMLFCSKCGVPLWRPNSTFQNNATSPSTPT